jgi:group I intron endonuclease
MKQRVYGAIYYIRCLVNGKGYVGQSVQHEVRWRVHINDALKGLVSTPLHRAIRKYGVENFTAEVLSVCKVFDLNRLETFYIKRKKTFVEHPDGGGYNLTMGGDAPLPCKETVERRAASLRRTYQRDPLLRQRTGGAHKGKVVGAETRAKIAQAHKGVKLSVQHVAALRASHASGHRRPTHTKEWSEKVSKSLTARYAVDTELRQRLSKAHKGKRFSEEHKRCLSEKRSAVLAAQTPEQRRACAMKMVEARLAKRRATV